MNESLSVLIRMTGRGPHGSEHYHDHVQSKLKRHQSPGPSGLPVSTNQPIQKTKITALK